MKKWILAAMMTLGAFAAAAGGAPASTTPVADEVATGTCTYTCSSNNVTYLNRARCVAACSGTCVVEAC